MIRALPALLWLLLASAAWADNKEDFLAARAALQKGDLPEVAKRADALARDPLGIYPRYWLLSRQLEQLAPEQLTPFLDFYQGSWLAEKLRGEWLLVLGRRGDWERFREQYRLLVDAPGTEQLCYHLQARLAAGDQDTLAHARAVLWFTPKDLPSACGPVLENCRPPARSAQRMSGRGCASPSRTARRAWRAAWRSASATSSRPRP